MVPPNKLGAGVASVTLTSPILHTVKRIAEISHPFATKGPNALNKYELAIYTNLWWNGPKVLAMKVGVAFEPINQKVTAFINDSFGERNLGMGDVIPVSGTGDENQPLTNS